MREKVMQVIGGRIKGFSMRKRILSLVLCLVCVVSAITSGTLTWLAVSGASNEFFGTKSDYQVVLEKKEKDLAGEATETGVAGAEFFLYKVLEAEPETTRQIGGRYVTDAEGCIKVEGLLAGSYFFRETNPSYGYEYDLEGEEKITRYDFEINTETADATGMVKVEAFNRKTASSLALSKIVENKDGTAVTEAQQSQIFAFTVTFGDGKTYPYTLVEGDTPQELVDGKLTLKHGETATFTGVPIGISYTVKEAAVEGYEIVATDHHGNIKPEGSKAIFKNRAGDDRMGSLIVAKEVTGSGDTTQDFTFAVELSEDLEMDYHYDVYDSAGKVAEGEIKSGQKITLKHNQWAVFVNLPVGTIYSVSEEATEGYTQQFLHQDGQIISGGNRIDFVNHKVEEGYGKLIITKSVKSKTATPVDKDKAFHFNIRVGEQSYTCDLKDGERYEIDSIPVGTPYEVVEDDYYSEGYVTKVTGTNGTMVEGEVIAAFTNTLTEPPTEDTYGDLILRKVVPGAGDTKDFIFYVKVGNNAPERVVLKSGEEYKVSDILVGTPYQIVEDDYYSDGYITSSIGASGTITQGESLAEYTNGKKATEKGDLEISKEVLKETGEEQEFTFNISFSDGNDYPYTFDDGKPEVSAREEGSQELEEGKFILMSGEKVTFKNLPAGVTYTVEEEAKEGYLQGILTNTGTIIKNATVKVEYRNEKDAGPKEVDPEETRLVIKKLVEGEGADLDKSFDFVLQVDDKEHEFSLKANETKIVTLPIGAIYHLEEKNYFGNGYQLTSLTNGFGIAKDSVVEVHATNTYVGTVTTSVTGTKSWVAPEGVSLPAAITVYLMKDDQVVAETTTDKGSEWKYEFKNVPKYDDDKNEILYTVKEKPVAGFVSSVNGTNLTNTYVQPVAHALPEVEKTIEVKGQGEAKEATFTFVLEAQNGAPMPKDEQLAKVQLNGEGKISFPEITYTLPGVYTYSIYEEIGESAGYTYDARVYTYTVTVERSGSGEDTVLTATGALTLGEEVNTKISFTNIYVPQEEETTSFTVNKVWAGTINKNQPDHVMVQLYRSGEKEGDPVRLDESNNWTHTFANLDKEGTWTVDEVQVPVDYMKTVAANGQHGMTITNTYTPDGETPTKPVTPSNPGTSGGGTSYSSGVTTPKTNDPTAMTLWFVILILSLGGLRMIIFREPKKPGKRK
ncbi:DUF7601 domain-containing protein [Ohessyouella blattaphilus]|uniref:DUF5979 domain-containing protein n=1 Tax=Ohessyouella blattaphilus TaxID=2949333 RepID=A0ABT1EQL3_9FIRM|nr:DUF5979 domain-containing protein [Ohessyouella blattaphilus]MCP1111557.1 DUF5979 domain-containing protein [Ohessyouella blattaphilus]MCR8564951.1 DUF5979 domain-containing protein [Ohessyouella blattaphilus]